MASDAAPSNKAAAIAAGNIDLTISSVLGSLRRRS
jgi:hypothetical protein